MIPDSVNTLELLQRAGCSERVILHCKVVAGNTKTIAEKICECGHHVDMELAISGALLHDIGRSITHGIRHGVEGASLAREYGLDGRLVRIIERHIGAGIMPDEAVLLGLPAGSYIPETLEEKIVAHADNLVEDKRIVTIPQKVEILNKKGTDRSITTRIIELGNAINALTES